MGCGEHENIDTFPRPIYQYPVEHPIAYDKALFYHNANPVVRSQHHWDEYTDTSRYVYDNVNTYADNDVLGHNLHPLPV